MDLSDPLLDNEGMELTPSSGPELLLPPTTDANDEAWDNIFELPPPDRDTPPAQLINDELATRSKPRR